MTDSVDPAPPPETFQAFKDSFFYGSRSNLDFKFLADLSETEAGEFFTGLLTELSQTINDGDGSRLVDLARVWQQRAYTAHLDPKTVFLPSQPSEARAMSGEEVAAAAEFLRAQPTLSTIPIGTPSDQLVVRHGGYPTDAARLDHNVVLPLQPLRDLATMAVIGELAPRAYSFVGATSQLRLRDTIAADWAATLQADAVDAVLLVPV